MEKIKIELTELEAKYLLCLLIDEKVCVEDLYSAYPEMDLYYMKIKLEAIIQEILSKNS